MANEPAWHRENLFIEIFHRDLFEFFCTWIFSIFDGKASELKGSGSKDQKRIIC